MPKKTEEPRPTMNCPRLNGYFAHKGSCDKFYYCVDGMFNMIMCPAGLVFNPRTGMMINTFIINLVSTVFNRKNF